MEKSNKKNITLNLGEKKTEINLLQFHSNDDPGSCGYCKEERMKKSTSYKWGFSTNSLLASHYERLMFMGWRRCGTYMYKPDLEKSCCKSFTIRLDVDEFKLNKNQRRIMKNFRKYISGQEIKKKHLIEEESENVKMQSESMSFELDKFNIFLYDILYEFLKSTNIDFLKVYLPSQIENFLDNEKVTKEFKVFLNKNKKFGDYSANILILLYHLLKTNQNFLQNFKTQYDFFNEMQDLIKKFFLDKGCQDQWKISLSNTGHLNFSPIKIEEYKEYIKGYLTSKNEYHNKKLLIKKEKEIPIHKNETNKSPLTDKSKIYNLPYWKELCPTPEVAYSDITKSYIIELEPNSNFSDEKYQVYKKYQMTIHNDPEEEVTPNRYKRSWGCSNLKSDKEIPFPKNTENGTNSIYPKFYGTYDLIHRIDGRIVAVGILDILPHSISSVYLYYDPDFHFLNLGVLTAIREIEFIKELRKNLCPDFQFYAMGFYIHTCQKMRYKGQYHPTQVLCPVTLSYVDLGKSIQLMEKGEIKLDVLDKERELDFCKNQTELDNFVQTIDVTYQKTKFNALVFINNFISEQHRSLVIKLLQDMVNTFGKSLMKEITLTVS
jgi:arginine-tRNA-protein transferase